MDTTRHSIFDNKVQLYMRPLTPHWHCACTVAGKQRRATTKEESLARAKDVARDWYLGLLGKYRAGELKEGKTFKEAAARFIDEFETITQGQRSPIYVEGHKYRINNHLNPFFGNMILSEITAGTVQDYRIHRMKTGMSRVDQLRKKVADDTRSESKPRPPARSTLHQEIVCLRQILKTANRHNWLDRLPNLSAPFQGSTKISHRAWFSLEEYRKLYKATQKRANSPPKPRWRWECEQLHDFVLFMANTGLRPDEAYRLQFRDVEIVEDEATAETILEIQVRGKRGVGYCKSMPNAVLPFTRLRDRERRMPTTQDAKHMAVPGPTSLVFPKRHHELFNDILEKQDLKTDREGQCRTAYSLRHTYICFRLMEGADIYQIAKNCRTSVEMIEKYYASHIKTMLDAAAINVRKKRGARAVEEEDGITAPTPKTKSKGRIKERVETRRAAPKAETRW
ncbi:MAG: site-specific integrase [Proteobacteria bacterium]|nr:site-specific integrase [Pseudomonadota bacterium]